MLTDKEFKYIIKRYPEFKGVEQIDTDVFGGINRKYKSTSQDPYSAYYEKQTRLNLFVLMLSNIKIITIFVPKYGV